MKKLFLSLFIFSSLISFSQFEDVSTGEVHGNFEINTQYYLDDSLIGANSPDQIIGFNGFANINYIKGKFNAGLRYESYQNALLGYHPDLQGNGITYRFAEYNDENLKFTIGNFYEQFGSGQLLRFYEARGLGFDNSLEGMRVKYSTNGIYFTGIIGKQRQYFNYGPGIVRGGDVEVNINELLKKWESKPTKIDLGFSAVSKYQKDDDLRYTLPENVFGYTARANIGYKRFRFGGEYTYKYNDPTADNNYIYKPGQSIYFIAAYSQRGLGINVSAKTMDNMFFRSDRTNRSIFNDLFINYIPALTKQHTYNLMTTLYPYATQPAGELAFQGDVIYSLKKGSKLGGKYGTKININYSLSHGLDTTHIDDLDGERLGYEANLFKAGRKYWQDFNVEIERKFNKKFKLKATYQNLFYNIDVLQGEADEPNIKAHVYVLDALYKISSRHSIRIEDQGLFTKQHMGSWKTVLVEYTYSPHWFVAFLNQYNFGNNDPEKRLNYPYFSVGYIKNTNRITIAAGKQRAGIFCVGGVCRTVPASNGISLSITSSF